MPTVVFIQPDRTERPVEVVRHESLMRAAVRQNVDGIAGECGGGLTCATCHVYVDPDWADRLAPPDDSELQMLEFVAAERRPTSRLSCQIRMADALAGLRVEVPPVQY